MIFHKVPWGSITSVAPYNAKFCVEEFLVTLNRSMRILLYAGGYLNRGKDVLWRWVDTQLAPELALPILAGTFLMLSWKYASLIQLSINNIYAITMCDTI